jgi:hypothetical protein
MVPFLPKLRSEYALKIIFWSGEQTAASRFPLAQPGGVRERAPV